MTQLTIDVGAPYSLALFNERAITACQSLGMFSRPAGPCCVW